MQEVNGWVIREQRRDVVFCRDRNNIEQKIQKRFVQIIQKVQRMLKRKYSKERITSLIPNQILSYILMILAPFFWVCGYIYCNQNLIHPIQTNFSRYLLQFIIQFVFGIFTDRTIDYKNAKDFKRMLLRGTLSALNGYIISFVQFYLPISLIQTISSTTVIFVFVLNYILYKEPISRRHKIILVIVSAGIVLTVNGRMLAEFIDPDYVFTTSFEHYSTDDVLMITLITTGLVFWMVIWSYSIIITSKTTSSFHSFLLLNSLVGFLSLATSYIALEDKSSPYDFMQIMIWSGLSLAAANYLYNLGIFISQNIGLSTMVNQVIVVVGYGISVLRYNEQLNIFCVSGSSLLLLGVYLILIKGTAEKKTLIK